MPSPSEKSVSKVRERRIQQAGGGRLYSHVSELRFVGGTTTEIAKTADRGGSNKEKLAIGALHCSALPSKFCLFASVRSDFAEAIF
jgi:hypothetical protein